MKEAVSLLLTVILFMFWNELATTEASSFLIPHSSKTTREERFFHLLPERTSKCHDGLKAIESQLSLAQAKVGTVGHVLRSLKVVAASANAAVNEEKTKNFETTESGAVTRTQGNNSSMQAAASEEESKPGDCYQIPEFNLIFDFITELKENSPEKCRSTCLVMSFLHSAVSDSTLCFCGNTQPPSLSKASDIEECAIPCPGEPSTPCGGPPGFFNVYPTRFQL